MLSAISPTMEELESNDIAHMVYNYLLEVRLMEAAELFFKTSPHLTQEQQLQTDKIPCNNAMRRISQVMHEFNDLQQRIRKLIWKYGKKVQYPPNLSVWEKLEYLIDHLHACQLPAPTTNATLPNSENRIETAGNSYQQLQTSSGNIDNIEPTKTSDWQQSDSSTYVYQAPTYEYSNGQQHESQIVYHVNNDGTLTLPTGDTVERTIEEPLRMCYVIDENGNGIQLTSNVLLTNGRETEVTKTDEAYHTQEQYMLQPTVIDENQMEVGQLVEIGSTETVRYPSQEQPNSNQMHPVTQAVTLPTISISVAQQTPHVAPETPKPVNAMPISATVLEQGNFENISIVANLPVSGVPGAQQEQSTASSEPIKLTVQSSPAVTQLSREEALAEWNRIRAINKSNFDNYAREINHQTEIQERLDKVLQQKQSRKQRNSQSKTKSLITKRQLEEPQQKEGLKLVKKAGRVDKVKATVRVAVDASKTEKGDGGTQRKKQPLKQRTCQLSESSDSACSVEDDESIRQMTENIKRYRRQRIRQPPEPTENKQHDTEQSTEKSDSVLISSISPQCHTKLSVDTSPPKAPATLRKNPAKTARNVRTPAKAKQESVTSTARAGTARQQQLRARKLAEAAETEKEENVHDTPMQARPIIALSLGTINTPAKAITVAPESSPTEGRRPTRTCTTTRRSNEELANRKTKSNEKTPKKTTTPRKKAAPVEQSTVAPDPTKQLTEEVNGATDRDLEPPPPAAGEVAEAAIYAVLAQLHGD